MSEQRLGFLGESFLQVPRSYSLGPPSLRPDLSQHATLGNPGTCRTGTPWTQEPDPGGGRLQVHPPPPGALAEEQQSRILKFFIRDLLKRILGVFSSSTPANEIIV